MARTLNVYYGRGEKPERHRNFPGFEGAFTELVAPEGTTLYVFEEDFLGEPYIVEESGEHEAL